LGYGERVNYLETNQTPDITEGGHRAAGKRAFERAGMKPSDIKMFQPYDDFLIAIVMQLEHLGFCETGRGCQFVNERDMTYR
ncbi:hypothetical protein ABI057_15890, partial [Enterococcus faecium]|uniref:thiolase C-terminal domain-containing protein n=1 Tax=Enterococcus faecium TaxID=1352 RepID=UPI003F43027E